MEPESKILLQEDNIISLRTALVIERDGVVALQLLPRSMTEARNLHGSRLNEWLWSLLAYLYQDLTSTTQVPIRGIKHLKFEKLPELKLIWSDSGNSVAVYLNGEPWAFVDEKTKKAYSKGIQCSTINSAWSPKVGNAWDQKVFENTFSNDESI